MIRATRDTPAAALALALGSARWTADYDFFGCGLPIWTTVTLLRYLEAQEGT